MAGAISAAIVSALLYFVLPTVSAEVNSGWGTNVRQRGEKLAQEIYSKLVKNSETREKLLEAYQNNDSNLMNALVSQAGYSSQVTALRNAMSKRKQEYQAKKKANTEENVKLTNMYNELNNSMNAAGSGIAANVAAEQTLKRISNLVEGGTQNGVQQEVQQEK